MAKEKQDAAAADGSENKKSKLPLIIGLVVVLLGGGAGGAYFMGVFDSADQSEEGAAAAEAKPVKAVALYAPLHPEFVLNFKVNGRAHFLKVAISLLTREKEVVDAVDQNMPLLRNELVMLFSATDFDSLKTAEGKESLRSSALAAIQAILEKEIGKAGVEQVLFTDFVLQ